MKLYQIVDKDIGGQRFQKLVMADHREQAQEKYILWCEREGLTHGEVAVTYLDHCKVILK